MSTIPATGLTFVQVPIGHPDAVRLIEEVQALYVDRYGTPDEAPIDASEFEEGRGRFHLAHLDGELVGMGAWRFTEVRALGGGVTAEIKRMYVVPAARGRGVARRLLVHLEATAAAEGVEVVVLETGTQQPEAIGLYTSSGYQPIPGYGFYCGSDLSRCFGRRL